MKKLFFPFALLFLASTIFIGCGSDEPYDPTPPPPPEPQVSNIDISNWSGLLNAISLARDINNANRLFTINKTGNIGVQDFSRFREIMGNLPENATFTSNGFGFFPYGTSFIITWADFVAMGRPALVSGGTGREWVSLNAAELAQLRAAGAAVVGYNSSIELSVNAQSDLPGVARIIREYVNRVPGARGRVSFAQQIMPGVQGLQLTQPYVSYLIDVAANATIANNNLRAAGYNIKVPVETLRDFNIRGQSHNNGYGFFVPGVNRQILEQLTLMDNQRLFTDPFTDNTGVELLDHIVPQRVTFTQNHHMDVFNAFPNLPETHPFFPIELKAVADADGNIPWITNQNVNFMRRWSSQSSPIDGAVFEFIYPHTPQVAPAVPHWSRPDRFHPMPQEKMDAAPAIDRFNFGPTGGNAFYRIMDQMNAMSGHYMVLLNPSQQRIPFSFPGMVCANFLVKVMNQFRGHVYPTNWSAPEGQRTLSASVASGTVIVGTIEAMNETWSAAGSHALVGATFRNIVDVPNTANIYRGR